MRLVGIDISTAAQRTGLAYATLDGSRLRVHEARVGTSWASVLDTVNSWLGGNKPAILAIDAPCLPSAEVRPFQAQIL